MKKILFSGLILLLFLTSAAARVINVTVRDADGNDPLTGVSVHAKTAKTYAETDAEGNCQIDAEKDELLVFSFIGYRTREVQAGNVSELHVTLSEDNQLDEIVVVGYGSQRRKELTGAVSSVGQQYLEYNPSLSLDGMLSGAVAGLNVTTISGQPGGGSEIRIRGGNSIEASNEPLYVIDGFIYFSEKNATAAGVSGIESALNPLASINISDIESIDILKDVSAKAIYGSRGANGVVLITTRKGSRGKNTINYQYMLGFDRSVKHLDLLNASQFEQINRYDLLKTAPWNNLEARNYPVTDTDWQSAVLQTGVKQTHEISVSGGDDKTRYLFSGNYTDQTGIVINSGYRNYGGRVNVERSLNNLTLGVNVNANRSTQNALTTIAEGDYTGSSNPFKSGITNSLVYALFMPPVLGIYDKTESDGYNHYNPFELTELSYYGIAANPVADLKNSTGQTVGTTFLTQFYAKYQLPWIDGLAAKFSAGSNINSIVQNFLAPPLTVLGINQDIQGRGATGVRRQDVTQTEFLLTYTRQLTDEDYIDILGGYTSQETGSHVLITRATHIDNLDNIGAGKDQQIYSFPDDANLHSFLGRVNYTFKSRYNLTATYRADKSSRFSEGNNWAFSPSVGVSWNVSDEDFYKNIKYIIPALKIRATCGSAGNQEIGMSEYATRLQYAKYGGEPAAVLVNAGNKNLKWETTDEVNLGIDAEFLDRRLSLTTDFYYKKTRDLLIHKYLPLEGLYQTINSGTLSNKGFELSLRADIISERNIKWQASINFARNINTILSLPGDYMYIGDAHEKILRVGESSDSFWGYIYDGVVQADEVTTAAAHSGTVHAGDIKLRSLDGNRTIDEAGDGAVLGSIHPDFTYGFSSSFAYLRWDVFLSLQGSQGNEVYNKLRRHLTEKNETHNLSADVLDAWTPENPSLTTPRVGDYISPGNNYSRYIEDGSYLKLRNLTLGYTLPLHVAASPVNLRVFLSGQNLLTFTRYRGYDPEVAGGIDTGVYPAARTLQAGARLTF
ncbi:MAG: TonB-dependent receptor [Dysgonamonadaceae bacterium]|jgi:TonB-linked SusC/RagA family outer membrane protein|nr:TonB-dependent receptor [Dysgonamonadaceae bacterium]